MPKSTKMIVLIALLGLLLAGLGPALLSAQDAEPALDLAATDTVDDEVILVLSDGRIRVEDPRVDPGEESAAWTSPEAGWTYAATADFNGDGDDEIIALGGSRLKIYDPFSPPGAIPVNFDLNLSPNTFFKAIGGDIDGDGRAELVVLRNNISETIRAYLWVYDGNATGTVWTRILELPYGIQWADMALGNFIGDAKQELVLTRPEDNLMLVMDPRTGTEITRGNFGAHFFKVTSGDFNRDGIDEIAALRYVLPPGANVILFKVKGVGQGFTVVDDSGKYGEPFRWAAAGDFDKDGADELAILRNVPAPYKGLLCLDIAPPLVSVNEVIGQIWLDVAAGDLDGDGYAKIIVLKDTLVRAYAATTPIAITWSKSGSYAAIATGNVDGRGIVRGPALGVTPTVLNFQMVARGASPAPRTVNVSNTNTTDVISWTATEAPETDWLVVSPAAGNTPGSFQVSINGSIAPPGVSQRHIVVRGGAGVLNSPITITVNLTVTAPTLVVSPSRLPDRRGRPGTPLPQGVVQVRQADGGSGSIEWTAAVIYKSALQTLLERGDAVSNVRLSEAGLDAEVDGESVHLAAVQWLQLTPAQGTTPQDIIVTYQTAGLPGGRHDATIVVDAGSGTINRLGWCDVTFYADYLNALPLIMR